QAKNWGYYRGTVALDGQWYPMLVPSRQDAWVWGMQEFVHADYTLRLTAAADQQVIASVPWTSRTQQHGRQTLSGTAGPLYQLGLSLSTQWQSVEDLAHAGATASAQGEALPPLRVLAPADDAPEARHMLQTLRRILAFYHQEFALSLRSPQFTVVVHDRDLSWPFSAAADNMLLLSRDLLRVPDLVHKLSEYFVARGLAGQWWGLHTAYNLRTERWVGEGLTTYMALRWLEHTYGRGRTFLSWKGAVLPNLSFWEQYIAIPYLELVADRLEQRLTTPDAQTPDPQGP